MTPPGVWVFFWSFLGRVFPLSLKGPTRRLRGWLRSAELCVLRWPVASRFLVFGPPSAYTPNPKGLTAPFCILPDSDSALPCFRVSCFCFCFRFAGKHTSEPCTARIASLRLSQHFLDTEQATATAQTQTNIFLRGQARSPSAAVQQPGRNKNKDHTALQHARDSKPVSPRHVMSGPAVTARSNVFRTGNRKLTLPRRNYG